MQFDPEPLRYFSLTRAIAMAVDGGLRPSIEREILAEASERAGTPFQPNRFFVPFALMQRGMTAVNTSAITGDDHQAARDVLRESSLIGRLGCEIISTSGSGQVSIPTVTTEVAGEWLADENSPATAAQPTVALVSFTPKHAVSLTKFSRQLLIQAPESDQLIGQHLTRSIGRLLDSAVLAGTGTNGQPQGLASQAGNSITGASFGQAEALAAIEDIRDNGTEPTAFVTTPAVATVLAGRDVGTDTGRFVMDNGQVAGIRAIASDRVPTGAMFLGDWSRFAVVVWGGGVELTADPYSGFNSGLVSLRARMLVDVGAVQTGAFAYTDTVS